MLFESVLADIRFALRRLLRSPGFAFIAILTFAIGIGLNTTLFTLVDALLLKPLPVASPERLVDVFTGNSTGTVQFGSSSYPDYLDLKAQNEVLVDLVGYTPMLAPVNDDNGSRLTMGEIVTGNYFRVLGVGAAIGRPIGPEDDVPGAPRVAMVSYRYWQREFGATSAAVGRTIRIRGNPFTIIGVVPATFTGMVPVLAPELWVPATGSLDAEPVGMHDAIPSPSGATRLERRGDRWLFLRGRLKPGKTIEQARTNLELVMARLEATYPATNKGRRLSVNATSEIHVHPDIDSKIRPIAFGTITVATLVLLITCTNLAGMFLARASARGKEIGMRLALGASRWRLVRQLMTESMLISVAGALVGTLVAWWATAALATRLPMTTPLTFDLRVDHRVLLFTLGITIASGVLAGLAPALQTSKLNLLADLRGEQAMWSFGRHRWTLRHVLVVAQMAISLVLLVAAALLSRSLIAVQDTNVGLPVERLAVVSTDPGMVRYSNERSGQFFQEALARIRALSGVESAALTTRIPLSLNFNRWDIWIPERHRPGQPGDPVETTTVSPEYFQTIGVPLIAGRSFTYDDRLDTPWVAIVNETFAKRNWPGESAIGKVFRSRASDGPLFHIVGVSADYKVTAVDELPTPFLHIARTQRPNSYTAILARTRGDAATLLRDMRGELLALEPNLVFVENQTMEATVGASLFPLRAAVWLSSGSASIAMLLAAVGLYGVIAYAVARRTREIGIRVALGARRASVLGLVMRQGLVLMVAGLLIGGLLALAAAGAVARALYGVRTADPVSWLLAAVVLVSVATLANLIPAWRAARVDPSVALRIE